MLFSHISDAEKYDYRGERFQRAFRWLAESDLEKMLVGSYSIEGEDVVAHVQEYSTSPSEDLLFETHDAHFDIQYLISGVEKIAVCKRDGLQATKRVSENDTILYEDPALCGAVLLMPGDFLILPPEDAHKPRCMADEPEWVRKVVVKVQL